jgi:oligoribonuclease NrnB/cAMP/cGMP phosphodiesterase (DHH superfamily)
MIKLFTDIDLDGFGCGLIAKIAFGEKADIAYCSHRNLNQRVESYIDHPEHKGDEIYITDLAVNEEVEKKLAKRFEAGKHIRMLDHHITAMHFNEYKWASVIPEYESGKKTCATSLFYDYLKDQKLIKENKALEEFIELVRQYDTWEWDENNNVAAKRLNDLFYILNREKFEEDMLKRILESPDHFCMTDTENMILDLEEQKINRYIHSKSRQTIQAFVDEFCVGIVHAEQYLSELGNALNTLYPHLDMIALLNMSGKKMGFRTIHDHINVADYAKRFGGGGHPKASGSEMTHTAFEKFVVNVFNLSPLKPDADRNELNLKEADYGTCYQNRNGEVSYIYPDGNGAYSVIHQGTKMNQIFKEFMEAESYVKRNYNSWLYYDKELIHHLADSASTPSEKIKENYQNIIRSRIEQIIK